MQSAASDYFVALFINYFSIVKYTYEKCYVQCQFLSFGQSKNNKKSALEVFKEGVGSNCHREYASTVMVVATNKYITYQTTVAGIS